MEAPDDNGTKDLKHMSAMLQDLQRSAFIAGTVGLGLRLNLYQALSEAGPVTSEELATRCGYHERWLREWLHCQVAAEILRYVAGGRFEIGDAARQLLVDDDRADSARQPFDSIFLRMRTMERLQDVFKSGMGLTWDDRGMEAVSLTENGPRNVWYRKEFAATVLPHLGDVERKLESGGVVVDLGCGAGVVTLTIAGLFPRSRFDGYDISQLSLQRAKENLRASGLQNVTFHDARKDRLSAGSVDFAVTIDCLHDMAHPEEAARSIRAAIKEDGAWFIEDVDAAESFEEELKRDRRRAAGSYATSLVGCLASSLSEPDGAGLGTLGLPEGKMKELVNAAGFTRFERLAIAGRATAAYYLARP